MTGQLRTRGGATGTLTDDELVGFVQTALTAEDIDGASVCVIVPDATRSCPLPLLLSTVHNALAGRARSVTVLVALGTHAPMSEDELARHLGYRPGELDTTYPGLRVRNHAWWDPDTFSSLGHISAERVAELSDGLLAQEVDVRLNRAVVEHDVALVVGPVFPHEVVGFSGGNKYFFPGVAGPEIIDVSHWIGALISSMEIIGTRGGTPVRALIDEAAKLIPARRLALCLVVESGTGAVHAAAFGSPEAAWAAAAEVSARTHVRYLPEPVRRVISLVPTKYDDMWTAAKGFYKVEPVVADGGEVILVAPHVRHFSAMHPEIDEIGYHCRAYFTGQWERFQRLPWGVLAHSTHLRGAGTWDPVVGERCRVQVTLATRIPKPAVRAANLGYLDPDAVDLDALAAEPGTLVVSNAGEVLYRLA
ncbi:lactate racemase domain-containing protein [Actinocrispum wychmicini]|uniref:Nickel-dependent lactate racemase n=1 Tax=Actinocrispum wychmicini TaxID=1213861 RepID=A0A4R2JQ37_9PSEU|nr:lactate racemase domain-containing protein [Actinocrispum wychmicini]TCO61127.1 nickel-dependent lactate racemase [Actinocrispum wychmicini]